MRRLILPLMLVAIIAVPARAQVVDLTDSRTAEQKWQRAVFLLDWGWIAAIAHAKSLGQTPEQYGRFVGQLAAPSWSSETIAAFVRGIYRNFNLYENLEFEILQESDAEIRARMNNPFIARFGETGEWEGVTPQEYIQVYAVAMEVVADHLGFEANFQPEGEWIILTVKR